MLSYSAVAAPFLRSYGSISQIGGAATSTSAPRRADPGIASSSRKHQMTSCGRQDRSRSESVASKRATEELPVIARFEVRRRNYLAPDGSINRPLPVFAIDAKLLVALYRAMVL